MEKFKRSVLLIGKDSVNKLKNSHVAVFGVGGVGGFTAEALIRSGVGRLTIIDNDVVSQSNINRQIIATENTVGKLKTDVMKERLLSINSNAEINTFNLFYLPETADNVDLTQFDYIVDAIDTVTAKLELIERATKLGIKIISCMGTGGKTDPTKLKVTDIYKTSGCPLARIMRTNLKKRGVEKLKVVYSEEQNVISEQELSTAEKKANDRVAPPSMIFVPSTAGIIIAREVVFDLVKQD